MPGWKIAGIAFDHMHMSRLLGYVVDHPQAEIVGICHDDIQTMAPAISQHQIPENRVYTDYRQCLEEAFEELRAK